jgi:hypothetical protein
VLDQVIISANDHAEALSLADIRLKGIADVNFIEAGYWFLLGYHIAGSCDGYLCAADQHGKSNEQDENSGFTHLETSLVVD